MRVMTSLNQSQCVSENFYCEMRRTNTSTISTFIVQLVGFSVIIIEEKANILFLENEVTKYPSKTDVING